MNQSHNNDISDKNCKLDTQNYPEWLAKFINVYEQLSIHNLHLVNTIYDEHVHFQDPIHEIKGIDSLNAYFGSLYQNLNYCHFNIQQVIQQNDQAAIYWEMRYQHKKMNNGNEVIIEGSSLLTSNNSKIIAHRDYLDLGAMIYEQLPLLGKLIHFIKKKAAN